MDYTFKSKRLTYAALESNAKQCGWSVRIYKGRHTVGCRGSVSMGPDYQALYSKNSRKYLYIWSPKVLKSIFKRHQREENWSLTVERWLGTKS